MVLTMMLLLLLLLERRMMMVVVMLVRLVVRMRLARFGGTGECDGHDVRLARHRCQRCQAAADELVTGGVSMHLRRSMRRMVFVAVRTRVRRPMRLHGRRAIDGSANQTCGIVVDLDPRFGGDVAHFECSIFCGGYQSKDMVGIC